MTGVDKFGQLLSTNACIRKESRVNMSLFTFSWMHLLKMTGCKECVRSREVTDTVRIQKDGRRSTCEQLFV